MTVGDSIQRYPLLRVVVPYVFGIALADVAYTSSLSLWGIVIGLLSLLVMFVTHVTRNSSRHLTYGIAATTMFVALGMTSYALTRDRKQYSWPSEECTYEAKVVELPRQRARSTLCVLQVSAIQDSAKWTSVNRKAFAYMAVGEAADSLLPGDVICFRGKVKPPHNFSEEVEFDYARYITMQGASGTVYLPQGKWEKVNTTRLTLRERMIRLSHRLQTKYMHTAFNDDALGVLTALSLGDKRTLSDEVRATYTDAGAAHVLALSGLHVGVIYAILAFVMKGMVRKRNLRWLRELLIIISLWLFALLTGMSASVVRAVGMCTLYILAHWISRDSSPIHILTLAALIMLIVKPLYLFDVGFQLSFMAMAAILGIEPYLEQLFSSHSLSRISAYFIGIICMSLAAQVGTFPLSLHHFGTFPTYFLLTNLLVIPYLFIILILTLLWWCITLTTTPLSAPLGQLLQHLTQWMNTCLEHISQWPGAVLQVSQFSIASVLFTYMFILFLCLFLIKKWPRALVYTLVSLLALSISLLV